MLLLFYAIAMVFTAILLLVLVLGPPCYCAILAILLLVLVIGTPCYCAIIAILLFSYWYL